MSTWILTSDRYPQDGQAVIYFFKYVGVHRGKFEIIVEEAYDGYEDCKVVLELTCFSGPCGFLVHDVTHWMPDEGQELPPKPEGY